MLSPRNILKFLLGFLLTTILCAPHLTAATNVIDFITAGDETFTNVTVFQRTPTDIFFKHAGGMANVKLSTLTAESWHKVGRGSQPVTAPASPNTSSSATTKSTDTKTTAPQKVPPATKETSTTDEAETATTSSDETENLPASMAPVFNDPRLQAFSKRSSLAIKTVLIILVGLIVVIWLLNAYCFHVICKKVEVEPGVLVWIPFLQYFPIFRAAGLPALCCLLLLVPMINVVVYIVLLTKLAQARGKSGWWAVIGIIFYPLYIIYLAFSE